MTGRAKDARKGKKRSTRRGPPITNREKERQRLFVALYCHPDYARNGTKAATDAGYSPRTAHVTSCRLLKLDHIRTEIDAEMARQLERTQITSDIVVKEWRCIGRANLRDLIEVRTVRSGRAIRQDVFLKANSLDQLHPDLTAAIRELEVTKDGIRVRLHDKQAALLGLAKHFGGQFRDPMSLPLRPQYSLEQRIALILGLFQILAKRRAEAIAERSSA